MLKKAFAMATLVLVLAFAANIALAGSYMVDLTHPIPTFKPLGGDLMKPDMGQPWDDSKPIPSFGQQTVLSFSQFPTNWGTFDLGLLVLAEHHGTHMDAPAHYVNKIETMEKGGIPPAKRLTADKLGADDLVGRVVLIDISGRVQSELAKNGGKPSPDLKVTNFSEKSSNVVTADDIAAIADQLDNGVWLVINNGWSDFFFQGADFVKDPYINAWNFPGMSHAAIDKLIDIENQKGITIQGIVADNIGIESGESSKGVDDKWTDSWYAHKRGLQRGWKYVENAANLGQLAMARPDSCTLIVGAPKHVRGSGGPSRVIALCEK